MPMYLVPLESEGDPIPLDKAVLFIGRHPDCDVVLTDSRKVSRKHCCVAQINDRFVVRDLGSMNGIRVNDTVSRDETPLKPGDELWVGDVGFRLEARSSPPARPRPPKEDVDTEQKRSTFQPKKPLRSVKLDRRFVSQEVPVAIPEEGADLIVEATGMRRRPPSDDDVIELQDEDLADEETD